MWEITATRLGGNHFLFARGNACLKLGGTRLGGKSWLSSIRSCVSVGVFSSLSRIGMEVVEKPGAGADLVAVLVDEDR